MLPKPGYPTANNVDQNDKPITSTSPVDYDGDEVHTGQEVRRHPANVESGTRQTKAQTDYSQNTA